MNMLWSQSIPIVIYDLQWVWVCRLLGICSLPSRCRAGWAPSSEGRGPCGSNEHSLGLVHDASRYCEMGGWEGGKRERERENVYKLGQKFDKILRTIYLISSPTVSSSDTLTFLQLWMDGIFMVTITEWRRPTDNCEWVSVSECVCVCVSVCECVWVCGWSRSWNKLGAMTGVHTYMYVHADIPGIRLHRNITLTALTEWFA